MRIKTYSSYKDSDLEWLGETPKDWTIQKLKYNSYIKGRIGWQNLRFSEFTDEGPYLVTGIHFKDGNVDWEKCYHISEERFQMDPYIIVKNGDVLITKDGTIGKLAYVDNLPGKASLNSHLLIIRPTAKQYFPKFLYYVLSSNMFHTFISLEQKGTTFYGISQESVENFPLLLPSITEQKVIAYFLDQKTMNIDDTIARKEQQSELLQEKRKALISNIVTKGLNPNILMKDTDIEWLKEIPKHWNIQRLKYTVKLINENVDEFNTDLPYIGLEHIESWTGKLLTQEMQTIYGKSKSFRTGDVLFGKLRPYLAKVIRTPFNGQCTGELLVMRPKLIIQDYLFYYILSRDFINIVDSSTYGAKMPRANWEYIGNLPILLPPETEQNTITEFLDREIEYIDSIVMKIQESINKLREYRLSLISACVTGKIDVRKEVV